MAAAFPTHWRPGPPPLCCPAATQIRSTWGGSSGAVPGPGGERQLIVSSVDIGGGPTGLYCPAVIVITVCQQRRGVAAPRCPRPACLGLPRAKEGAGPRSGSEGCGLGQRPRWTHRNTGGAESVTTQKAQQKRCAASLEPSGALPARSQRCAVCGPGLCTLNPTPDSRE